MSTPGSSPSPSIRRQLTVTLLRAILALLGGGLTLLYFALREELTEQFDDSLLTQADFISDAFVAAQDSPTRLAHLRDDPNRTHGEPLEFFEVRGADGRPVFRSHSLGNAQLETRPLRVGRPTFWPLTLPTGRPGRAVGLISDDETRQVIFACDREELDEALRGALLIVAGSGALLLVATAWLVPRLLRRALLPLDDFAAQASRINADSLSKRFNSATAPAELQPVAARLNDLLARLEQSFERERRVSADLAHELRTPLAELRMLAENALKWPESRDATTDRDALAVALQMESIVERMLALARSEDGRLALTLAPVDLTELLRLAWRPFAARAAERQLTVEFALHAVSATTDAVLMRSILVNLFDNAVDYTPAGGRIEIACGLATDGRALIRVTNTVENLTAEDVARLFERFWRKESARAPGAHVGLGLSLVRAFADALGWEITATLTPAGCLTLELRA